MEYIIWQGIKARCYRKKHKNFSSYGERGILMQKEWINDFMPFLLSVGNRPSNDHSIDRVDNNKGYCAHNCRWTTRSGQQANKRTTSKSGIKGVKAEGEKWSSSIRIEGVRYWLGSFARASEAQAAYNEIVREWYGR